MNTTTMNTTTMNTTTCPPRTNAKSTKAARARIRKANEKLLRNAEWFMICRLYRQIDMRMSLSDEVRIQELLDHLDQTGHSISLTIS